MAELVLGVSVEGPISTTRELTRALRGEGAMGVSGGPRGMLRNGNPAGDPTTAPRCGARTRRGTRCLAPAMRGRRRCRLHGGLSSGPRTPEGLERSRRARWKHGGYSAEACREFQLLKAQCRAFNAQQASRHATLYAAAKELLRKQRADLRRLKQRNRARCRRAQRALN